jgi:hypothetical protein
MARVGISITKSTAFRNSTQEFSNVYYYDGLVGTPSETEGNALIDEVADREKTFHATTVTFVRGRIWLQAGSPGANQMIAQKNLSGTGARPSQSYDKERAFLFRIRAGSDSRGNPVYLRKWYHACGSFTASVTVPTAVIDNTTGFSTSERAAQVAQMNSIGSVGTGGTLGTLVSKNGRTTTAGQPWQAHQYLEHHQLGDQWRAQ